MNERINRYCLSLLGTTNYNILKLKMGKVGAELIDGIGFQSKPD